jgi:small conductance mechanosensitive channel
MRRFSFLLLITCLLFAATARAEPPPTLHSGETQAPPSAQDVGPSTEQLQELVSLLEDESRRQTFIENLNLLIEARKAVKADEEKAAKSEVEPLDTLSEQIDDVSGEVVNLIRQPRLWLAQIKLLWRDSFLFLSEPENLADLWDVVLYTLTAVVLGLLATLLRRRLGDGPTISGGAGRRVLLAVVNGFLWSLPCLVVWLSAKFLFGLFPVLPSLQEVVQYFFFVFFLYRLFRCTAYYFLAPRAEQRVLGLSDQDSEFFWRWFLRFSRYAVVYFVVTDLLLVYVIDRTTYFLLRNLLLLVFPIFLTFFLPRMARRVRAHYAAPLKESDSKLWRRLMTVDLKYWDVLLLVLVWALTVHLLISGDTGFLRAASIFLGSVAVLAGGFVAYLAGDALCNKLIEKYAQTAVVSIKFLRMSMRGLIALATILILIEIWGLPLARILEGYFGRWDSRKLVSVTIAVLAAAAVIKAVRSLFRWLLEEQSADDEKSRQMRTLFPIIGTALQLLTVFVGGLVVLKIVGIDLAPLLAGAGIAGLALGLGAQSLIKDVINGVIMLFQDIIAVGDWVQLGDKDGLVEEISLRNVRLRDFSNNVHLIPNSHVSVITNYTKKFSGYILDTAVAYKESIDQVIDILTRVDEEIRSDPKFAASIMRPLEIFGLDRFSDSAVIIRSRVTTRPMTQWAVAREYNRRIKEAFDRAGVEIPFPHRTLYMGRPKDVPAPPLNVKLTPDGEPEPEG